MLPDARTREGIALLQELRYSIRSLRRSAGFSIAAIGTLGVAISLCTMALVVTKAYLLDSLPYPAADRLHWVRYAPPNERTPGNMESADWSSLQDIVEHQIAWDLDMFYVLGGERAEAVRGAWVTPGFVQGLGVQPAIGRTFEPGAFKPGSPNVALISHRLWTSRFGADPAIVGRTFKAYVSDRPEEAEAFTVIGVLPAEFWHINPFTEVLAPLRAPTYPYMLQLKPGVTPAAAAERVTALVTGAATRVPEGWRAVVESAHDSYVVTLRPTLRAVTAAAGLVLLVACANVAGLMLVRATKRRREVAIRAAIGASRWAIVRMVLAEVVVLATAATGLALYLSDLTLDVIARMVQQQLGRPVPGGTAAFATDTSTLAIATALGAVAALVCTMVSLPGVLHTRLAGTAASSRTATEGRSGRRLRSSLIALEVAASLTLLAGSTLLLRTVVHMVRVDLGFDGRSVIYSGVTLRQGRYPDAATRGAVFDRMEARLRELPRAETVALTTSWPLQQPQLQSVAADGGEAPATRAGLHSVSSDYFSALRIPILGGRPVSNVDRPGTDRVAVVSETVARRLWPGKTPIGERLIVEQRGPDGTGTQVRSTVVGIAGDVRQGPTDQETADVYLALAQDPGRFAFVMLRVSGGAAEMSAPFSSAFRDIDPEMAVNSPTTMDSVLEQFTARPRFLGALFSAFASAAGLLALVGVYGVIAYAVRQREREIAVRIAVGADPARLTRLFLREGAAVLLPGLVLGTIAALAAGRLIESQLFGVTARDPLSLAVAAAGFAGAGLLAIWWPARRAALTDPAIALRSD